MIAQLLLQRCMQSLEKASTMIEGMRTGKNQIRRDLSLPSNTSISYLESSADINLIERDSYSRIFQWFFMETRFLIITVIL